MIKLFKADIRTDTKYRKTLRLGETEEDTNCVHVLLSEVGEDYESYIKDVLEYFKGGVNLKELLNVDNVVPMGCYIRGIFGGEKKKGKKPYAGLVFDLSGHDPVKETCSIRLHNTGVDLEIPAPELERYWFKLIYRGGVHPFYIGKTYDILLSKFGKGDLSKLLHRLIQLNKSKLDPQKTDMILTLVNEVQQPVKLSAIDTKKYYTVYRGQRAFSSAVVKGDLFDKPTVIESHLGYIETSSKSISYYYSGILNYLVYKCIYNGLAFQRDQFERPLHAVTEAGLSWEDAEDIRGEIAALSEQIHEDAKVIFHQKSFSQEKEYFSELSRNSKFIELVEIIDSHISEKIGQQDLVEILSRWVVSGVGCRAKIKSD